MVEGIADHPAEDFPGVTCSEERAGMIRTRIEAINDEVADLTEEKLLLTRMLAGVWLDQPADSAK